MGVKLGGYGYYGKYTDISKTAVTYLNSDLTIDLTQKDPLQTKIIITEDYDELIAAADFLLTFAGVRLQGEYVFRFVDYNTHNVLSAERALLQGANPLEDIFTASNTGNGVYGLIAWELPLAKWINPVRITPYFIAEYNVTDDTLDYLNVNMIIGGINVKPSPYVTLKVEHALGIPTDKKVYSHNINLLCAQLAVSF